MDETFWARQYENVMVPPRQPVLAGFNVNLDRILQVTKELLNSPEFRKPGFAELRSHLIHSMEHCTAEEWFVADPAAYTRFMDFFSGSGSLEMGGQAGIAALHLARTGAPEVYCLAPAMGARAADMLMQKGVRVPGHTSGAIAGRDDIHLIFEYRPGLVPLAEGAQPRNNRFIVSPKKTAENTIMPDSAFPAVLPELSSCTRSFLSGYQYLRSREEFIHAADQIRALKTCNRDMRVHIECVSVVNKAVLAGTVNHILPAADSAGMNEHELGLLLGRTDISSPTDLVKGVLGLAHKTGLARIHLHTFGYYLLAVQKDRMIPEASRAALLHAARVVADAAGGTGTSVSKEGISAVRHIEEVFGQGTAPGTIIVGDYQIIAVPTLIASGNTKTAGLGDILSSTAFVTDLF